jgi:outer membrane receptor for ferrienterochelin and colicins
MRGTLGWTVLLLAAASPGLAQGVPSVAGRVTAVVGRVTDASTGRALVGVRVDLVADGDTLRAVTDARGEWRAPLRAKTYRLTARTIGFRAAQTRLEIGTTSPGSHHVALTPLPLALDQMVVTAARREQRLADVVATTELITRDDIERTGATDLASVMLARTGVELSGGTPAGAGAMLQGLGSERVLVLLDGQPIAGRVGGEFDASRIPVTSIERIEIVKGPQSTLYGTDAMGGVINLISRTASDTRRPDITGSIVAGSQNRRDASLAAEGSVGRLALRGEVGRRSVETTPGRADERGALSERLDFAANARVSLSDATTFDARVLALDERQRWLAGSLYDFGDNTQWTARTGVEQRLRWGTLRAAVYGSVYDHLHRVSAQPQPIRGDTGQRQVQRIFQGEVTHTSTLRGHVLELGAQVRRDDTKSVRIPGGRRAITSVEPLAQLETAVADNLSIVTGARVSSSDRWGTTLTPRLALRYRPLEAVTVRASVGTGFRAPDFGELYLRFRNDAVGYAVYGNPNLRPERSRSAMLGADWAGELAYVRVQTFWNEFRGFIETRIISAPGDPPLYEYGNVDEGFTRGVDLEGAVALGGARLESGYSFLETRDRSTGRSLLGRPTHSARSTLLLPAWFGLRASVAGSYSGRTAMVRDSAGAVSSWRDAYPRFDARVTRSVWRRAELTLGVENVLDRRPREWAGFTGRQVTTGLRWQ